MCLASAYSNSNKDTAIMENISSMEIDGKNIKIETMFGEERFISGNLLKIDFEDSRVIIELTDSPADK